MLHQKSLQCHQSIFRLPVASVLLVLAFLLLGCNKKSTTPQDAAKALLARLRLPEDTKSNGTDEMGRNWLKIPVRGPDGKVIEHLYDERVYDPNLQVLYRAKKDAKGGYLPLIAIRRFPSSGPDGSAPPRDSIEGLGLGVNAEDQGTDENGMHWFGVPAVDSEGRVIPKKMDQLGFNPKTKILSKLTKDEKGRITMEPLDEQPK